MSIKSVIKTIRRHDSFLISTHVNPDPDALCSEMAVYYYLKSIGKKVKIVNNEEIPARLRFLPGTRLIKAYKDGLKFTFDAVIIVDCGSLDRVGKVARLIDGTKTVINIDHHITNDNFGSVNLVRPKASSTAEILFDVLKDARCAMNKTIALHLYAGIMTDTGSFRYENTTAKTHRIVAELKEYKFSSERVYQQLYDVIPASDVRHYTKVISNFQLHFKGKVVTVLLKKAMLSKFSKDFDLRDTIFRLLRSMSGVEVVAIFTEAHAGLTRVNFRSAGRVNVAKLAHSFDGGGHHNASGCKIDKKIETSKKDVLKKLEGMI